MASINGAVTLMVNGARYPTMGDFEYSLGGRKVESFMGQDGERHTSFSYPVAFIEGEITLPYGMSLAGIQKTRGATVVLITGDDRKLTLTNADFVGEGNVNSQKSSVKVRWEGDSADLEDR